MTTQNANSPVTSNEVATDTVTDEQHANEPVRDLGSSLATGREGDSPNNPPDIASMEATAAVVAKLQEGGVEVTAEPYWWGFEITLNAAAVTRLNTLSALVAASLAFAPQIATLVGVVVAARAVAYEMVAGSGGLVIASPWPMPLMLAPVRAAHLGSDKMSWTVFSQGTWKAAAKFPGSNYTNARPTFATYRKDLYLLHRGAGDQNVWYIEYEPDLGWGESTMVPQCMSREDVAAFEYKDRLHVVHRGAGSDKCLWHIQFDGRSWNKDSRMDYMFTASGPALATFNGLLYCVARGMEDLLWFTTFNGSSWSRYAPVAGGHVYSSAGPALAVYKNALHCVARGTDHRLWWTKYNGSSWSQYVQLGGGHMLTSDSPSLCVFQGRLFCVARGNEGLLWWTVYDGSDWRRYLASDIQVSEYGPALIVYSNQYSQRDPELLCAFKGN